VLAAAGGACAAALTGCATYNANNGGVNGPPPTPPTTASGSSSAPSGAPAGALASTSDIPVGGGDILTAKQMVITQPTAGTFKAFTAVCTHQGCIVDAISAGTIDCPCHGSRFSIKDGSVVNGPATQPLASIPIKVEGTSILPA
jgi:nitrite reductase/ring-hydroxylating ferredoxin subunit